MYGVPEIACMLQTHWNEASDTISDIHGSPAWQELYYIYGTSGKFNGDRRAIALEFSADGFSPFHHSTSAPYSSEQQASVVLYLLPDVRTKPGFVLLHGIIPGKMPYIFSKSFPFI